jgi:hypothetical protein
MLCERAVTSCAQRINESYATVHVAWRTQRHGSFIDVAHDAQLASPAAHASAQTGTRATERRIR